jgi:hypothetical protein
MANDRPRSDSASRLNHLDEMAAVLWPGAQRVHRRGPPRPGDLLIAPAARRPRMLLPATSCRASASAVLAQGVGSLRTARLQRRLLAAITRIGLGPWLMPDRIHADDQSDSITAHLSQVLGRRLELSTSLTFARANRKPVLHLLDPNGDSVAWAKVGVNELTYALVAHESKVLTRLNGAEIEGLQVPGVVYSGEWHGLRVLALSSLPTRHAARADAAALSRAMLGVADMTLATQTTSAGVRTGTYVDILLVRAASLTARVDPADAGPLAELRTALGSLRAEAERVRLTTGAWHGDWTPWNCAQLHRTVLVWDWERFDGEVPRGFDALHYRMQDALVYTGGTRLSAARDCIADAPETLAAWSLTTAAARLVAALYLGEIALRYVADKQRAARGPGADIETWIVPALVEYGRSVVHADLKNGFTG